VVIEWEPFVTRVRQRGEYATGREAGEVVVVVLAALGAHLTGTGCKELAGRLPERCSSLLVDTLPAAAPLSPRQFVDQIAGSIDGATVETARWDTFAVLSTVADLIPDDLLRRLLNQLLPGYALLFGRTELS
jgi:uncharacterized protein (DUF2267 family)